MKKIIILQILGAFSLLLVSCGSQETTSQTNNITEVETTEAAPQTATTDTAQITGQFSFKIVEGEYSPMTTVSVLSNGQEYLVDEIVGGAMIIDKGEYESMGIPPPPFQPAAPGGQAAAIISTSPNPTTNSSCTPAGSTKWKNKTMGIIGRRLIGFRRGAKRYIK